MRCLPKRNEPDTNTPEKQNKKSTRPPRSRPARRRPTGASPPSRSRRPSGRRKAPAGGPPVLTAARRSAAPSAAPIRPRLGRRGLGFQAVPAWPGTRSGRWRPSPARGIFLPPPRGPPALCFGAVARPSRHKRPRNAALANRCPRPAPAAPRVPAPRPAPRAHPRFLAPRGLGWSRLPRRRSWGSRGAGPGEGPLSPESEATELVAGRWAGPGPGSTGLRLRLQAGGPLQLGPPECKLLRFLHPDHPLSSLQVTTESLQISVDLNCGTPRSELLPTKQGADIHFSCPHLRLFHMPVIFFLVSLDRFFF